MKINKKHLTKYLEEHGYHSLDLRKKLGKYGLKALCEYLNSIDDSEYADYLMTRFNKLPKKNYFSTIVKKDCGCGYGIILLYSLEAYKCKFCSKISGDAELSELSGNNPALVAY